MQETTNERKILKYKSSFFQVLRKWKVGVRKMVRNIWMRKNLLCLSEAANNNDELQQSDVVGSSAPSSWQYCHVNMEYGRLESFPMPALLISVLTFWFYCQYDMWGPCTNVHTTSFSHILLICSCEGFPGNSPRYLSQMGFMFILVSVFSVWIEIVLNDSLHRQEAQDINWMKQWLL